MRETEFFSTTDFKKVAAKMVEEMLQNIEASLFRLVIKELSLGYDIRGAVGNHPAQALSSMHIGNSPAAKDSKEMKENVNYIDRAVIVELKAKFPVFLFLDFSQKFMKSLLECSSIESLKSLKDNFLKFKALLLNCNNDLLWSGISSGFLWRSPLIQAINVNIPILENYLNNITSQFELSLKQSKISAKELKTTLTKSQDKKANAEEAYDSVITAHLISTLSQKILTTLGAEFLTLNMLSEVLRPIVPELSKKLVVVNEALDCLTVATNQAHKHDSIQNRALLLIKLKETSLALYQTDSFYCEAMVQGIKLIKQDVSAYITGNLHQLEELINQIKYYYPALSSILDVMAKRPEADPTSFETTLDSIASEIIDKSREKFKEIYNDKIPHLMKNIYSSLPTAQIKEMINYMKTSSINTPAASAVLTLLQNTLSHRSQIEFKLKEAEANKNKENPLPPHLSVVKTKTPKPITFRSIAILGPHN